MTPRQGIPGKKRISNDVSCLFNAGGHITTCGIEKAISSSYSDPFQEMNFKNRFICRSGCSMPVQERGQKRWSVPYPTEPKNQFDSRYDICDHVFRSSVKHVLEEHSEKVMGEYPTFKHLLYWFKSRHHAGATSSSISGSAGAAIARAASRRVKGR